MKLNVKRLNRLSWLLAGIIGFIFYIIYYNNGPSKSLYPYTLLSFFGILLVGHADVLLMVWLGHRFTIKSRQFTLYRTLITYPLSILIYLVLWPLFAYLARFSGPIWSLNLFLAFIGSGVVMNTMIIMMHNSVLLYDHKVNADLEVEQLKTVNAEAKNLLLKQQIHPHFLFNALNTLKALYHKDTTIADDYIVHMANFLRASIYNQSSTVSTLEAELSFLNDYLEMQRIRFGNALQCSVNLDEADQKIFSLPSFSLQPLLENAIKHNNFTQEFPLRVEISKVGDRLLVTNNLQRKTLNIPSTNFGLANLADRYRLCSGEEIFIHQDENQFSVCIKLLNNDDNNH